MIKNELAIIDENWCEWIFVEFLEAHFKRTEIKELKIFVEISPKHFLPNTKKPETGRG